MDRSHTPKKKGSCSSCVRSWDSWRQACHEHQRAASDVCIPTRCLNSEQIWGSNVKSRSCAHTLSIMLAFSLFSLYYLLIGLASATLLPGTNTTLEARAGTFSNPLNQNRGADPCMRFINGRYFLTSTQNTNIQMRSATTIEGLKTASPSVLFSDSTSGRYVVVLVSKSILKYDSGILISGNVDIYLTSTRLTRT